MNARARQLGLRSSHYVRPDGLDAPGHVSSAHDVTFLARLVMHRPAIRQIVRMRTATLPGGRVLHTWNDLLYSYPGIFGVKTGHTSEAGWNQVAAARRGGVSIYATLIGSPDRTTRNRDLAKLLDWGFSNYTHVLPVVRGREYAEAKLGYGRHAVALVAARSISLVARLGRPLVQRVVYPDTAALPVSRGQSLGQVRVYQEGRLIGAVPLVAARSVSRPGIMGRTGWYAGRTLHHVLGWF
jgi:D-alanyl-D-alanine carboxypeptidase (penicillin-binding protein 5/6)